MTSVPFCIANYSNCFIYIRIVYEKNTYAKMITKNAWLCGIMTFLVKVVK